MTSKQRHLTQQQLFKDLTEEIIDNQYFYYCYAKKKGPNYLSMMHTRFFIFNQQKLTLSYCDGSDRLLKKIPIKKIESMPKMKKQCKICNIAILTYDKDKFTVSLQVKYQKRVDGKSKQEKQEWKIQFNSMKVLQMFLQKIDNLKKLNEQRLKQQQQKNLQKLNEQKLKQQQKNLQKLNEQRLKQQQQKNLQKLNEQRLKQQQKKNLQKLNEYRLKQQQKKNNIMQSPIGTNQNNKNNNSPTELQSLIKNLNSKNSKDTQKQRQLQYIPSSFQNQKQSSKKQLIKQKQSNNQKNKANKQSHISDKQSAITNNYDKVQDWNKLFYQTKNHDHIHILCLFKKKCQQIVVKYIQTQKYNIKSQKKYNMQSKLTQFDQSQSIIFNIIKVNHLSDQQLNLSCQNQFNNYNYLLQTNHIQANIKVPLTAIVQYRGIICFCKAKFTGSIEYLKLSQFQRYLFQIEKNTGIKKQTLLNKNDAKILKITYTNQTIHYYFDNLVNFIPCLQIKNFSQFLPLIFKSNQKSILGGYYAINDSQNYQNFKNKTDIQIIISLLQKEKSNSRILLKKLDSNQIQFISSIDLLQNLQLYGVTVYQLPYMYKQSKSIIIRKILLSQICAQISSRILKCRLQQAAEQATSQQGLIEIGCEYLNDIFSLNDRSSKVWEEVGQELGKRCGLVFKREQLSVGYFISSLLNKLNMKVDMNLFRKKQKFFRDKNVIQKNFVKGYLVRSQVYGISFDEVGKKLQKILLQNPNQTNYNFIMNQFNLKNSYFPPFFEQFQLVSKIKSYLINFAFTSKQNYPHLQLFDQIYKQPPTQSTIKYLIEYFTIQIMNPNQLQSTLLNLFHFSIQLITFWFAQYHVSLNKIYQLFANYYVQQAKYQLACVIIQKLLFNTTKLFGTNNLYTAKYLYSMADIHIKSQNKIEALKYLQKCKKIVYSVAGQEESRQLKGDINYRLSCVYLNLDNFEQAIIRGKQAMKIYEDLLSGQNIDKLLNIYELLIRIYDCEDKGKKGECKLIGNKVYKYCGNIKDISKYKRMVKIMMNVDMIGIEKVSCKSMIKLIQSINMERQDNIFNQIREHFKKENVIEYVFQRIKKIKEIAQEQQYFSLMKWKQKQQNQKFIKILTYIVSLIHKKYILNLLSQQLLYTNNSSIY